MRHPFLVIAAMGLLAAPFFAQAQPGNFTMYGRLNLTLEYIDASSGYPELTRLSSNSSRLGIRGFESLGGGLFALFQIESSILADAGGGTLAGRDTFVGARGPWGTLRFGMMLAPYDDIHPEFGNNATLTTSILSTSALWSQGFAPKQFGGFDARLPNSIRYDTPNLAGFVGGIQLSLDSEDASTDPYVLSAAGLYANGPFSGGIAYERNKDVRGAGLDDWAFSAVAGWDFGVVRLAGLYERLDYKTPTGHLKRNLYGITATAPVANGTLYAAWIHAADGSGGGSRVVGLLSGANTSADQWEVSYTYPLSRRTFTYVGYVCVCNDRNAGYQFNINPYFPGPPPLGVKLGGFVGGLVHSF